MFNNLRAVAATRHKLLYTFDGYRRPDSRISILVKVLPQSRDGQVRVVFDDFDTGGFVLGFYDASGSPLSAAATLEQVVMIEVSQFTARP